MKKSILIVIIVIFVIIIGITAYFMVQKKLENNNNNNQSNNTNINNDTNINGKKILVVYYSAQNHTANVAKKIANSLNADIFEIVPKEIYTSSDLDWTNQNSRVSREHNDASLRNVELQNTKVENFDKFDVVLIGYPIWWKVAAWPVNSFVKANDFTGKIVIPFCTSSSSGIGESGKLLEEDALGGTFKEGQRFSSNASDNDIKEFTDNLLKQL